MADNQDQSFPKFAGQDPKQTILQAEDTANAIADLGRSLAGSASAYKAATEGVEGVVRDVEKGYRNISKSLQKGITDTKALEKVNQEISKIQKSMLKVDIERASLMAQLNAEANRFGTVSEETKKKIIKQLEGLIDLEDHIKASAGFMQDLGKNVDKAKEATNGFAKAAKFMEKLPLIGSALAKSFTDAGEKALEVFNETGDVAQAKLAGLKGFFVTLGLIITKQLGDNLLAASDRTGKIQSDLRVGISAANDIAKASANFAASSGDARVNTERLIEANIELNKVLGTSVNFSEEQKQNFIISTKYLGISAEAYGKLSTIAAMTGKSTDDFRRNLTLAAKEAGNDLKVRLTSSQIADKISKLSYETLVNFKGQEQALGKAVIQAEKYGLDLEKVKAAGSSLLDFESSIANELEAELLTGRQLNLEKARAAALTGNQADLMRELANAAGTLADFENMNVIQRESLAKSLGLNVEQMSEMLVRQELMTSLGDKAAKLNKEDLATVQEKMRTQGMSAAKAYEEIEGEISARQKFADSMDKIRSSFSDLMQSLTPFLESVANTLKKFVESGALGVVVKGLAMGGALLGGFALVSVVQKLMSGMMGVQKVFVINNGVGGAGGTGGPGGFGSSLYNKGTFYKGGQFLPGGGRAPAGGVTLGGGLTKMGKGVGLGAVAGLAGMGLSALGDSYEEGSAANVGFGVAGGALSGAGTGAMIGSMIMPGAGTAIGAGLGAAIGGLTAYLNKKDKEDEKSKDTGAEKYDKMIKLLEEQARKDTKIFMDANQVGISMALGNPRLN